eukprot:scaffold162241_cov31-Tisochrysis_lutea.AAC.2
MGLYVHSVLARQFAPRQLAIDRSHGRRPSALCAAWKESVPVGPQGMLGSRVSVRNRSAQTAVPAITRLPLVVVTHVVLVCEQHQVDPATRLEFLGQSRVEPR